MIIERYRTEPAPPLDYYLILPESAGPGRRERPEAIVVEEFVLAADHTAAALDSTGWTPGADRWWSSAAVSRDMRVDPRLRARSVPVERAEAADCYHRLGGGDLPDEDTIRGYFGDRTRLDTSPPLRLGTGQPTEGYRETRVYRILFAGDLPAGSGTGVVGTADIRLGADAFSCRLRRIGTAIAWCVDVTADLSGGSDRAVGQVLRSLMGTMRGRGLIPATIERFS